MRGREVGGADVRLKSEKRDIQGVIRSIWRKCLSRGRVKESK